MIESPKETIISVVQENRALRWVCIILAFALCLCAASLYFAGRKQQLVWIVTEDGRIANSKGKVFEWEVESAVSKAVTSFYVDSQDRDRILTNYYSQNLIQQFKEFKARESLVGFRTESIEHKGNRIEVEGTLIRQGQDPTKLLLTLEKADRSDSNPFGLVVVAAGKPHEKTQEGVPEGLLATQNSTETVKK